MTQVEEPHQPNNLFNLKKGKNFHRRTQSSNAHDFDCLLNHNQTAPKLMEEIARQQGVADASKTLKAVDASTKKQDEKHVTIEDINEIPKNIGWIVPKNPYARNPMQVIKRQDPYTIDTHFNNTAFDLKKKIERLSHQEHLNEITGLSTVLERNHSNETSEIDPKELKSENSVDIVSDTSSRRAHTRTSSCYEPSIFSGKCPISTNTTQNMTGVRLSIELNKKIVEDVSKNILSPKQQIQSQPVTFKDRLKRLISQNQKYQAIKIAKEKYHLSNNVTPQAARNFLKVLEKHHKAPLDKGQPSSKNVKKPMEIKLENHYQEGSGATILHNLETKIETMSSRLEQLDQKAHNLVSQVTNLRDIVKILTKENQALKQDSQKREEKARMLDSIFKKLELVQQQGLVDGNNKQFEDVNEKSGTLHLSNFEDASTMEPPENESRNSVNSELRLRAGADPI